MSTVVFHFVPVQLSCHRFLKDSVSLVCTTFGIVSNSAYEGTQPTF